MEDVPVITLSNGLRIANFSSPHAFNFIDGSILPACSDYRAKRLMLEAVETEVDSDMPIKLIRLDFSMSEVVKAEIIELCKYIGERYDLILCPLPVLNAINLYISTYALDPERVEELRRFVGIRVADRITKSCHIDKYCTF
jgi:hypothetical protein